jgi:hypothetical protein
VLRNMRTFYYRRDDSLTGGDMVFHTKMNSNIKPDPGAVQGFAGARPGW